jgi:hypothetical protein
LDSIKTDSIFDFLRAHHSLYLDKTQNRDTLHPFKEEALLEILRYMRPEYHYLGYFLSNCGDIARKAVLKTYLIDAKFVSQHKDMMKDV